MGAPKHAIERKDKCLEMGRAGKSAEEIASALGYKSAESVKVVLNRGGLQSNTKNSVNLRSRNRPLDERERILLAQIWTERYSMSSIMARVKRSEARIQLEAAALGLGAKRERKDVRMARIDGADARLLANTNVGRPQQAAIDPIAQREQPGCSWIEGEYERGMGVSAFCNAETVPGKDYCETHLERMRVKSASRPGTISKTGQPATFRFANSSRWRSPKS